MFDEAARSDLEFLTPEEISQRQNRLLREHVRYVAQHSPFYRKMFAKRGIDPAAIRSGEDLCLLPFTTKADLQAHKQDMLCVDSREVVDYCLTSGTTGDPVAMQQTRQDLERVGFNEEISFRSAGIDDRDVVLVAASIDRCFMAGLAYFLGLNRIGATAIRGGTGNIAALMQMVVSYRPTSIVGVPTLMLNLGSRLRDEAHDPAHLGVTKLICIGEPVRSVNLSLSALGAVLEQMWQARVFGTYASTEIATAFCDCEAGNGGHLHPDLIVVEMVDEEGHPVRPGEAGEVVATPLQVTGMPLLRFKTGDMAHLHDESCLCGRNSPRLGPIIGRKSQMLKYRGTTVYPSAIFSVLQEIGAIRGYYMEVYDEFELSEQIRVVVGTSDPDLTAEFVAEKIAARTRVKPQVVLAAPAAVREKTLQEGNRKRVTFFDHRRHSAQATHEKSA